MSAAAERLLAAVPAMEPARHVRAERVSEILDAVDEVDELEDAEAILAEHLEELADDLTSRPELVYRGMATGRGSEGPPRLLVSTDAEWFEVPVSRAELKRLIGLARTAIRVLDGELEA
jgi:hypothetical protein